MAAVVADRDVGTESEVLKPLEAVVGKEQEFWTYTPSSLSMFCLYMKWQDVGLGGPVV